MKKNLTEVIFILDRSGSMGGLEKETINGFNSLLEKQQKEEGEAVFSTILFDNETEVLYDRIDIKKIEPMTDKQYYVRGCTALLDAIGTAIHHIKEVHRNLPEEEKPEKTLFIITTDGMENASRKYDYAKVKKMVEKAKSKRNWEFMFLGANIDAIKEAGKFGISSDRAVNYKCDKAGTAHNFSALSKTILAVRCAASMKEADMAMGSCIQEINEDYEARK